MYVIDCAELYLASYTHIDTHAHGRTLARTRAAADRQALCSDSATERRAVCLVGLINVSQQFVDH